VSDEVYRPICHGRQTKSTVRLPHATLIAHLSKVLSIVGVRTGWMIEHDSQRRQQYWTARLLLDLQYRHREKVFRKSQPANVTSCSARPAASRNLKLLERFMADHRDVLGWIPPQGGMTTFSWLVSRERPPVLPGRQRAWNPASSRRLLRCALHFRLGFAATGDNFSKALDRFGAFVKIWSAKMVTA
jgi:hypothetical protein